MSKSMNNNTKEDDVMTAVAMQVDKKQIVLDDLKDALLELNERRKNNEHLKCNKSSWRDLFDEDEE